MTAVAWSLTLGAIAIQERTAGTGGQGRGLQFLIGQPRPRWGPGRWLGRSHADATGAESDPRGPRVPQNTAGGLLPHTGQPLRAAPARQRPSALQIWGGLQAETTEGGDRVLSRKTESCAWWWTSAPAPVPSAGAFQRGDTCSQHHHSPTRPAVRGDRPAGTVGGGGNTTLPLRPYVRAHPPSPSCPGRPGALSPRWGLACWSLSSSQGTPLRWKSQGLQGHLPGGEQQFGGERLTRLY